MTAIATRTSQSRTMTGALVERLRDDILAGHLQPGTRLRLPALSERYGASLIPLREALARLTPHGLVEAEEQRGFRVAPISREHLLDVTETRVGIESMALQRSMERGDVAWEAGVLAAHHLLSRAPMTLADDHHELDDRWEGLHVAFHDALVSGCGLPTLLSLRRQLADQATRYRRLSVAYDDGHRDVWQEHAELTAAVMSRKVEVALPLLGDHFWKTTKIVLSGLGWPQACSDG